MDRPDPAARVRAPALLVVIVLALACAGVGCPCVRGAVNASPDLRWWLFSNFGASKVCPEMKKRGVPLKLASLGAASVGRFFPRDCRVDVDDQRHAIVVTASGTGYASLPVTRRIGFYCGIQVEYLPDFRLESDATYVWGKFSRLLAPPDLRIIGVENPVVNLATRTPAGDVATVIGQGVVTSEIVKGFTVVRQDDGDDFALGILNPPDKPKRHFKAGEDRQVLASDITQLQGGTREFLGPFTVDDQGAALYVKANVTGAPLVYAVMVRSTGDTWRASYEAAQPLGPPPGALISQGALPMGESSFVAVVPKGEYLIVVENRAQPIAPLGVPLPMPVGEAIGYLTYSVEVGDKP